MVMKARRKDEEEEFLIDDPELQAELDAAIEELDRGEGMDAFEFLRQLRAEQIDSPKGYVCSHRIPPPSKLWPRYDDGDETAAQGRGRARRNHA